MIECKRFRRIGNCYYHPKCKINPNGSGSAKVGSNVFLGVLGDGQPVTITVLKEGEE
jgi:hypothetical protein